MQAASAFGAKRDGTAIWDVAMAPATARRWRSASQRPASSKRYRSQTSSSPKASTWGLISTLLLNIVLHIALPSEPHAQTVTADTSTAIAGNPGAVNVTPGTGAVGRWLGLAPDSGVQLGGVLVSNGNVLLSGGSQQGATSFNNLLLLDLETDLDRLAQIPGASFGVSGLRFDGEQTNAQAGTITGYNGLPGAPPLNRTELYELWWRQSLLGDRLIFRIGKMVPTYDFGNVARPVPVQDDALRIPAVTGLLYTPVFVNPTILGAMPGYYNSAWGVMVTAAPNDQLYGSAGIYDGNGANGVQTGLQAGPTVNTYKFGIAELGAAWLLGPEHQPGSFGAGGWSQTGTLSLSTPSGAITQNGTHGLYAFGSQSLWRGQTIGDTRSVSAFMQVGANNSRTMLVTSYVGFGLTAFGVMPARKLDSVGIGVAWSTLNRNQHVRPDEILIQGYGQIHVFGTVFLQPTLTVSPQPATLDAQGPAVAFTLQSTILF
jgi:porin